MYSNSSSFLSGTNSSRQGPLPFGQASYPNAQGQQLPNDFTPQSTSFSDAQVPSQFTGYPGQNSGLPQNFQSQQQQPQYTGYAPQTQQPTQNTGFQQQPLQTGQAAQSLVLPQRTGQTSSQIAQSFQSTPPGPIPSSKPHSTGTKIPKIRLSFLMAQDQAKFEQLFKSAVGDGQALDGDKVRDLLIRSKLPGSDLMHIWVLSDTTKSGQLLFPEFALAMYLCNLKLVGKELPQTLPEVIANEVSSMVDIISFGVPDDRPHVPLRSNAPNFDSSARTAASPSIQQPQPQTSNSQLLTQLTAQPTGFASQYIPPRPMGYQLQGAGFSSQRTNFQSQPTGLQQNSQVSGYSGSLQPLSQMPLGLNSNFSQVQPGAAPLSIEAQPTGRPSQWGLVNAPASGLPNIEALQQRMMPQPGREGGFTTTGLSGSATVPWAVTKDEKKIYDQLFKAWDGFNKGMIGGDVAIEVMGQSGLEKSDLERIWTLSDPGNKGKLNMDEFAVAMHLIYRKLNGYPVPTRLPPELIPPSTRNLAESIGTVKSLLSQDAETRKNTGAFLQPQKTGVSYLKNHSFRNASDGIAPGRKDATVFRNNDDDVGYKSSARRRLGGGGRTPSPVQSSSTSETSNEDITLVQLRKMIREKQVLLDAMDFKDKNVADEDAALDRKDRREAEDLYRRIRKYQEDIDTYPGAALRNVDSGAERRALKRQLQGLIDKLPELASHVRRTERDIADTKLELFRLKDTKANPRSTSVVAGTGPGGSITEADRLKARAKAMMQQRSAALTGKQTLSGVDDASDATRRLESEQFKVRTERENNERMIRDVEDSVRDFSSSLEEGLKEENDSSKEHEKRRWEEGLGVEEEVKDFIFDLQRSSRSNHLRYEDGNPGRLEPNRSTAAHQDKERYLPSTDSEFPQSRGIVISKPPLSSSPVGSSYASYKTAEERAAFIKQQAEQRMAERLAALGLKPPSKPGESMQQRQDREAKERDERLRQAEIEDAKRDQERQRRLADEQPSAPAAQKSAIKKPPPPPARKSRADSLGQQREAKRKTEGEDLRLRAEQEGKEQAIKAQQKTQMKETQRIEDEAQRQEDDLAKEREATQVRLKALEEQVKAGKVRKQEEKKRKLAAEKEAKEQEAKLRTQRAELQAAREKERQLQLQLESLDDEDSSDEDRPQEITPQETTPTNSVIIPKEATRSAATPATVLATSPSPELHPSGTGQSSQATDMNSIPMYTPLSAYSSETKNPFFKKLSQSSDQILPAPPQSKSSFSPATIVEASTNPFHRLTLQENAANSAPLISSTPTGSRPSRVRPEEDEWSVVDSTEDSSGDEDDDDDDGKRHTGGSAKQLASILFGTMAPPRPLSAMDEKKSPIINADATMTPSMSPSTPVMSAGDGPAIPPPPPPMPIQALSTAPGGPPPPPPMPGSFGQASSAPSSSALPMQPAPITGSGPPSVGALLGDIKKGKGLKKVETKDRSQASVAGRVL